MDSITSTLKDVKLGDLAPHSNPVSLPNLRDTYVILRNVIPLTDNDRAIAQANISYAQSISMLDNEIENSEHISVELKNRRDELCRFEELERGLLAPIRILPVDILRDIILLAHYSRWPDHNYIKIFPLIASQVCSFWRRTAHSFPLLWTDISCRIMSDRLEYGKLIQHYLHYSKELPLSLSFESGTVQGPELFGDSCVRALRQNAHRWEYVSLDGDNFTRTLFAAIPEDVILENLEYLALNSLYYTEINLEVVPRLSELSICCYYCDDYASNIHVTVESAPYLTNLTLDYMHHPSAAITGLDWSLIQRFEANSVKFEPYELNQILERMSNLLSLKLQHGTIGTMTNVTSPHLQFLYVGSLWGSEENILNVLTTPRLRSLYIGSDEGSLTEDVVEFALRSKFRLEQLTVSSATLNDSWLIPEFSCLKTLVLKQAWARDLESTWRSIKRLTYESVPSPNDIFPMLENLDIRNLHPGPPQYSEWTMSTLIDILKSRLAPLERTCDITARGYLKNITIYFGRRLTEEEGKICSEFVDSELVGNSRFDLISIREGEN